MLDDRIITIGDKQYERMAVSISALLEGQAKGLFEQLLSYMEYIGHPSTEASVLNTALRLTFYVSLLDPVIKKEVMDFILELRHVLDYGAMEGLQDEADFMLRVRPYIRRRRKVAAFNSFALRELATFMSYDRGGAYPLGDDEYINSPYQGSSERAKLLLEGKSGDYFVQLRKYVRYLGMQSSDEALLMLALEMVLYVVLLDPVVKKQLRDFLLAQRKIILSDRKKVLLSETGYVREVLEFAKKDNGGREINEHSLREMASFLGYDITSG